MSADNGIYILRTKEGQNRVLHTKAINGLYWDSEKYAFSEKILPQKIINFFGDCKYTYDTNKAVHIAIQMSKKQSILEYGINIIPVDITWNEITKTYKEENK